MIGLLLAGVLGLHYIARCNLLGIKVSSRNFAFQCQKGIDVRTTTICQQSASPKQSATSVVSQLALRIIRQTSLKNGLAKETMRFKILTLTLNHSIQAVRITRIA